MVLSVCIPTFNRGNLALEKVNELLPYLSEDLDLWVLNNHSELYTEEYEKIGKIDNKYLHYVVNDKNIGSGNFRKCITTCDGKYCLLISDEDHIYVKNIYCYVEILKGHPDISFLKASGTGENTTFYKTQIEYAGLDSLRMIYQKNNYISGLIYNKDILTKEVLDIYDQAYAENVAYRVYSHQFWADYCALKGTCVLMGVYLIRAGKSNTEEIKKRAEIKTDEIVANHLSYTSYESRMAQFRGFLDEIYDFGIDDKDKIEFIRRLCAKYLFLFNMIRQTYNDKLLDYKEVLLKFGEDMKKSIISHGFNIDAEDMNSIEDEIDRDILTMNNKF